MWSDSTGAPSRDARRELTAQLIDVLRTDPGRRQEVVHRVVELNLEVAATLAERYRGRGVELEDLRQVAYLALVRSAERFDPGYGDTDFLQFAVPTIRGELRRYFRDLGWAIRPPRSIQELQPRLARASEELTAKLHRSPRISELTEYLGEEEGDVIEALAAHGAFSPVSLDQPVEVTGPISGTTTLGDLQTAEDRSHDAVEAKVVLHPVLRHLDDRERHIVRRRFYDGWTQREIGEEIGVSQMQVSRLLSRALDRLREQIGDIAAGLTESP